MWLGGCVKSNFYSLCESNLVAVQIAVALVNLTCLYYQETK